MFHSVTPLPLPLPTGETLILRRDEGAVSLHLDGEPLVELRPRSDVRTGVAVEWLDVDRAELAIWAACHGLFSLDPQRWRAYLHMPALPAGPLASGLLREEGNGWAAAERSMFWQRPWPWLADWHKAPYPQMLVLGECGRRHPCRAPKPSGELYRRFDRRLGQWFSLRTLDIGQDLERFNRWQNQPRVLQFWQEGGTLAEHGDYLRRLAADPHSLTLIGCFDERPFAYFEVYWAKEDRIAPYYDAGDYDRGVHMLVGEDAYRGAHRVACWLPALLHYLFLDDPRTQRIVSEPRVDNARMIGYMQEARLHCEKEFDFPHKRAALMMIGRERFFDRCVLS